MGIPLIIFAKAPVPGQVKTRLIERCGAETAAYVAELLLTQTVKTACEYWPGKVIVSIAGDQQHPIFISLSERYPITFMGQSQGDLGQRMFNAFLEMAQPATIIGADVPYYPGVVLQQAWQVLSDGCNVIGPALDGGYYLIGLQQAKAELFRDINWGSNEVYASTLVRAKGAGVLFESLEPLSDLDIWSDIELLVKNKTEAIPELTQLYLNYASVKSNPKQG